MFGYWNFFPTEAGWGRVPAMGWGEIVASAHPEVAVGGRYYGWFPLSSSIDMTVSATADGVRDDGEHRAAHAAVYRAYAVTERDPFYQAGADAEDRHALLRGLFLTAFLADDFFAAREYCGAQRVVILSASSKTAIGLAQRASARDVAEIVGVTSARNADFVKRLGWYDRVVTYDDIESIGADVPAVSIDMAGDGGMLARLHAHLGEQLRYSMIIGLSHHETPRGVLPSHGPAPEMFFAPTQAAKRLQEWGGQRYREMLAGALCEFVDASRSWLEVKRSSGPAAAAKTWQDVHAGRVPPNIGPIVSLASVR
jgi:hypothetical protein